MASICPTIGATSIPDSCKLFNAPICIEKVLTVISFLYMLILVLDANFRLMNRLRLNAKLDPPLSSGSTYFVNDGPYQEHLKNYVSEVDVSSNLMYHLHLSTEISRRSALASRSRPSCRRTPSSPRVYVAQELAAVHAPDMRSSVLEALVICRRVKGKAPHIVRHSYQNSRTLAGMRTWITFFFRLLLALPCNGSLSRTTSPASTRSTFGIV